eukprot:TRINITY_DN3428_c0_g1_i1.p1 TRINITY_DN3428_c0_g1~~TRINITY_DN3428_c0_g1_i1.p1  ORF type:complete len:102 (+),score=3.47 TRINITY_DN3428_c0_g1_i1:12-317(+)
MSLFFLEILVLDRRCEQDLGRIFGDGPISLAFSPGNAEVLPQDQSFHHTCHYSLVLRIRLCNPPYFSSDKSRSISPCIPIHVRQRKLDIPFLCLENLIQRG